MHSPPGPRAINHDEDGGTLAVGRRADLAVLDHNVFAEGAAIADSRVNLTVAGGRVVFDHAHAPATAATPAG